MTPARPPASPPAPIALRRVIALCTAGGFLDGYSLLIMTAALLLIIPHFHLSSSTTGIVTAVPFLGMALGALGAGPLTDRFGRRPVFIIDIAVFFFVAILTAASQNVTELAVFRFFLGLAIGADMPTSSSMLAEFSPTRLRGALTSMLNTVWLFGGLVAAAVGFVLYQTAGPSAWRWMFLSAAVPALVVALLRRNIPETPNWLRVAGHDLEADQVETRLSFSSEDHAVVAPAATRGRYRDLLAPGHLGPVAFFAAYWLFQSIGGAPLLSYTAVIFHRVVKFSGATSLIFTMVLTALYVLFSLLAQFAALENHGRKPVAAVTCGITALGAVVTAFALHVSLLLVVAYAVTIIASQLTVIPFWPWSVEQLPTRVRSTGQAVGSAGGKVGAFIGILFLPSFLKGVGWTTAFLSLAALFACLVAFVVVCGRETRQRSLNETEVAPANRPLTRGRLAAPGKA